MSIVMNELARNITGYFLVLTGVLCVVMGSKITNVTAASALIDLGKSLAGAALLAFQMKRSPDGNTTTTSVTVPPPDVASVPVSKIPKA